MFVKDVGKESKYGEALVNVAVTEGAPALLNCKAADANTFWEFCGFGVKSTVSILELLDALYLYYALKQGGLADEHKKQRGSDNDELYLYFAGPYCSGTTRLIRSPYYDLCVA